MKITSLAILAVILLSCINSNNKQIKTNEISYFDTTQLVKTAEMLDEDIFWGIVDRSLKNTTGQEEQVQYLVDEIEKLTPKEIIGFRLRTDKLLYDSYTSEMWCAGYIMNGGCSDDGFEYFRNWVISKGKKVYYSANQNPDNLINITTANEDYYEFENFWYVALTAFRNKTGKELYDYIDNDNFKTNEGNYKSIMFNWEESKPASIKKICPRLYAKLWK